MTEFQKALLAWFRANHRAMPWRKDFHTDPYAVWVSEMMLQQTTVAAVIPYFVRWMERFPTAEALAAASEDEVLGYWQGLGYYSRARNLLRGVRQVAERGWPLSVEEWRQVPGVGEYTAGAVASIAQGVAAPVVDGNVERVFARLTMDGAVGPELKNRVWGWASENLVPEHPGEWNQALMELGATVCTPKNPRCGNCPVSDWCQALQAGRVGEFPTPKPKKQWVELNHVVVVPIWGESVGLIRAEKGEWWEGLWHPPRGRSVEEVVGGFTDTGSQVGKTGAFKHVVTRHKISVEVWRWEVDGPMEGLTFVPLADLDDWAVSAPGRRSIAIAVDRAPKLPGLE